MSFQLKALTRTQVIFGAACLFAAKSLIHPDVASVAGMVLFLGLNAVDVFYGACTSTAKYDARVATLEDEVKQLKIDAGRVSMTLGIRNIKPQQ